MDFFIFCDSTVQYSTVQTLTYFFVYSVDIYYIKTSILSHSIPSKLFNLVTRKISGIELNDFNCGLKAYKLKVVKNIEVYGEMHRYIPVIAKWSGFVKIGEKVVQHRARKYGVTKFGLERFVFGFLDLLSITFVSKFKKKPMHFFGTIGLSAFLLGIVFTVWLLVEKQYCLLNHLKARDTTDNPMFYISLIAIVIGMQMFMAGYLGEIINVTSQRKGNDYLIEDKLNLEN